MELLIHQLECIERRGSVVVSTSAWHAAGQGFDSRTRHVTLLGVKTWLSTLEIVYLCVFSEETLKAFYLVSMPGEVKDPTQGVNRHIGVNRSAFGGTVPHFHQMSRVPRNETDVPHF